MAGKPTEPPPFGSARHDGPEDSGEQPPPRELLGPVAIERLRKDDGRALILYSSIEPRA
jgi:hypothetical protein